MNNENKKIIRYDTQTGEPIYEQINNVTNQQSVNNQVFNNSHNLLNQTANNSVNTNDILSNTTNSYYQNEVNNQSFLHKQSLNNNSINPQQAYNQYYTQQFNPSQQYNPNQPVYNLNNKKGNAKFVVLASILSLIIIALVVVIIMVILRRAPSNPNKNVNNTINEYETTTKTEKNTTNQTSNNEDTISLDDFEFKKLSGYIYNLDNEILLVSNNDYAMEIQTYQIGYNLVKGEYEMFLETFEEQGLVVNNYDSTIISGKEVMYFEIQYEDQNMLFYVTSSPSSYYIYMGGIVNANNNINLDDLNVAMDILNMSSYVGNSSDIVSNDNFNTKFDFNIDELIEKYDEH